MTVVLHFVGGPKCGGCQRISSHTLHAGCPIKKTFPSYDKRGNYHGYLSAEAWKEGQVHVQLAYTGSAARF